MILVMRHLSGIVSPLVKAEFNYISFINSMLSLGLSSPLYTEVREKEDWYII
jgi:hypothetical protein